jgi:hypothetical protein
MRLPTILTTALAIAFAAPAPPNGIIAILIG